MEWTPRIKQILQVLLETEEAISAKALADRVGVSKRTVQRELEYMGRALKDYELRFRSRTGVGIWLEGSAEEKERLLAAVRSGDSYDAGNREERRKRLVLEILKEKGFRKLFYYSSAFGVSEATVSADLEAVEPWLNRYGLYVNRKPGSGIAIEGSEENYRRAIRAFINENMDTRVVREAYEEKSTPGCCEALNKSTIGQILNEDIMRRVMDCLAGIDNARVLTLTENSYVGLVIHISIAINRVMKHEVIEPASGWQENVREDADYELARTIVRELEEEFEVEIPKVEISYICLHIKGAKHERIPWGGEIPAEMEKRGMQQMVNAMIDRFDAEQAYLLKQDDVFIQGLLAHLQPTLVRIIHGMHIENPVLDDIKAAYPGIYAKCEQVAKVLEENTGKRVPEEEVGFLAVHFGAAMVRLEDKKEEIRKVYAGVICSSGIGISRLMISKLESVLKDRIVLTAYGKNDITPYIIGKNDFFISSMPMEPMGIPVITVNPLLNDEDMNRIWQMTYRYERLPGKYREEDTFSMQLEEINLVAAQINTVIKYMEFFQVDRRITFEELLTAVGEKLSPYSDRREMIREDIRRRERLGSQVFAEFGFALLHTRTRGVTRPGFTVCMTKDLGAFEDPYLKGVAAVFVMLVPEDEHVKVNSEILGYMSSVLIEDYTFMETILGGKKEEIREALSRHLKKYFNKYIA